MDLKVCLKCILSFIFCIWRSKSVNSMECEIGNVIQKPDFSSRCHPQTDFHGPVKDGCQFFSCRQKETVDWKIVDPEKGILQVELQGLPKSCEYEWYDVDLEVYDDNVTYNETYMCDTGNMPWKFHSRRTLENNACSNCSLQASEECIQMYTIIFGYVYPSFYRIKVTPYVEGSTRQAQRSYRMHINNTVTRYVKKKFTDLNLNASLQYRSAQRELDLGIPLLIEDAPDAVRVDVKLSYDYIHLYGIRFGKEDSSSIQCDEKGPLLVPSCKVQNAGLECKFFNMSQGFYSVHVHFTDDRCKKGTIWSNQFADPCYWIIKKNFSIDGIISETVIPSEKSPATEILYTVIVIVVLIGVIIVSFIVKKMTLKRQRLANGTVGKASDTLRKTNTEQTYSFNNGQAQRFNFGQFLTLSDRPRPEVLLVYTRETSPFMELIACLRRVLDKICKCQVYDYFDPELWNDVSEDPRGWVYALIVERQAKVIIVASEVAALRQKSLMEEFIESSYKSPHPFDRLFLYALRLLRDGMDEDSYKNHFVVTFDGFTESNHVLEYFNPYTRFILPKHLNKLFEHLHPGTAMHFDTNRLEERAEVRQLRLQLEHLKNLKLLGSKEIDTHRVYNW